MNLDWVTLRLMTLVGWLKVGVGLAHHVWSGLLRR